MASRKSLRGNTRSYGNAYYWYDRIAEYSRKYESDNQSNNTSRGLYSNDYDHSRINRYGTSYGAKDSRINLGSGDNLATISARAGSRAVALENTALVTGKGDDVVNLNATALGENSRINQSLYLSQNEHDYNYKSNYKYDNQESYQANYGRWWNYKYTNNWSDTTTSEYKNQSKGSYEYLSNYANSYINKTRLAIGINGSRIKLIVVTTS